MPPAGLTKLSLPNPFPSLPPTVSGAQYFSAGQNFGESPSELAHEEEQGWFYYLSEISVLRTASRMLRVLYSHDESWWLRSIDYVLQQIHDFEIEIDTW